MNMTHSQLIGAAILASVGLSVFIARMPDAWFEIVHRWAIRLTVAALVALPVVGVLLLLGIVR